MGAKLICSFYNQGKISKMDAKKMMSFCSISGPMFIVGTVGLAVLNSVKAGIVILISNLIACLINGLIYRGKKTNYSNLNTFQIEKKEIVLSDIVYDSIISILMVGGFVVISFVMIDAIKNIGVLNLISNTISCVSKNSSLKHVVESIICGIFEITNGIISLSTCCLSLKLKTVIASTLISFSGICIMLQSISFLKIINMKFNEMLKQKLTQSIITLLISIILVFIVF